MATKPIGLADMDLEESPKPDSEDEVPLAEEGTPEEPGVTLPRSVFGGMELTSGQTLQMRVVKVAEDGVQVELVGAGEKAPERAPKGDYQEPNAAIDQMAGGY